MPSFQNPAAFLLLILIPILFLLRKMGFFSKISFVITLSDWGGESFSWNDKLRKFVAFFVFLFTILGYVAAVTALAGPIIYKQERVYTSRGTDILFVLDISPSMAAQDMNGSNRLESAKNAINYIVENNTGASFGVVAMAAESAVVVSSKDGCVAYSGCGLNDIVVTAKTAARTILLDVAYNYVSLGKFKADGIIISTPTGSTAYSSSAGGPIIDPEMEALLLTPINSFSLSTRPLVLSPKGEVEITVLPSREHEIILTIDGQKPFELQVGDCIKIRQIAEKVKLVGCTTEKFYEALQSKLNWAGGPHA